MAFPNYDFCFIYRFLFSDSNGIGQNRVFQQERTCVDAFNSGHHYRNAHREIRCQLWLEMVGVLPNPHVYECAVATHSFKNEPQKDAVVLRFEHFVCSRNSYLVFKMPGMDRVHAILDGLKTNNNCFFVNLKQTKPKEL